MSEIALHFAYKKETNIKKLELFFSCISNQILKGTDRLKAKALLICILFSVSLVFPHSAASVVKTLKDRMVW